jgi:predicted transposase YbfD/YdcC
MPEPIQDAAQVRSFMDKLETILDPRDNRGKRHPLPFVLAAVTLAILAGRSSVSGIQRYIKNKIEWLRDATQQPDARFISRAQLPRILAVVDWQELNTITESQFGVCLEKNEHAEWTAIDGKTLRGTDHHEERTLLAVTHTTRTIQAQRPMTGPKDSEITAARDLLRETGLDEGKVTLDALHFNPKTTRQIHQAGGLYVIQVKDNQPELKQQLVDWATRAQPLGVLTSGPEKAHGRIETRQGTLVALAGLTVDSRWAESGFHALVVMKRQTVEVKTQKRSVETSYYVSNLPVTPEQRPAQDDLFDAIRGHWSVEADNYIRDVTLGEDAVKTKNGNQGHILATLRTLAMGLLRKANIQNFRAALDDFTDNSVLFKNFLEQVNFL